MAQQQLSKKNKWIIQGILDNKKTLAELGYDPSIEMSADVIGSWNLWIRAEPNQSPLEINQRFISILDKVSKLQNLFFIPTRMEVSIIIKEKNHKQDLHEEVIIPIPNPKELSECFKTGLQNKYKKDYIVKKIELYGYFIISIYDKNGNITDIKCSESNLFSFRIGYYEKSAGIPENQYLVHIATYSDIWLNKVWKTDESKWPSLHYNNEELAKINSKRLSDLLSKLKQNLKPFEISLHSEFNESMVTKQGFDQQEVEKQWGDEAIRKESG